MKTNFIRDSICENLSGFYVSESMRIQLTHDITGGRKVKKKLTVAMVLLIVIVGLFATALAVTIFELVKSDMQKILNLRDQGTFERWGLEDKERFVDLMQQFNVAIDEGKLELLHSIEISAKQREQIANEIINTTYGERMRSRYPEDIDQPEDYPVPDYYTLFEDLWLMQAPGASESEIQEAYEAWEVGAFVLINQETEVEFFCENKNGLVTETEILDKFDSYLSEVLSFSKQERQKTSVTLEFLDKEDVWQVSLTIHASDARVATKEYLANGTGVYNPDDGTYSYLVYFLPNGQPLGSEPLGYYVLENLIPSAAYPGDDPKGHEYLNFLEASVEEKALFSQKWKPVVDQWLKENPEMVEWLMQDTGLYAAILCTHNVYGVPSAVAILQERAIELAIEAYLNSGITNVSEKMIQERCSINCLYDVSDVEQPLWKIDISYAAFENPLSEEPKDGYHVILDALTGQIIDEYTHQVCIDNVFQFAEKFM